MKASRDHATPAAGCGRRGPRFLYCRSPGTMVHVGPRPRRPQQGGTLVIQDNIGMQPDISRPAAPDRQIPSDPVGEILAAYRLPGPWQWLEATGVANRIYATQDVVLRVATDHPDAIVDACTESIAAPVARQAGILTP